RRQSPGAHVLRNSEPPGSETTAMKYFTPEKYVALQNFDAAAMDAADAAWDDGVARYETYLQSVQAELPEAVRKILDGFYLHDADVLSMGRQGETFTIVLQLDPPPRELLTLNYLLDGEPIVRRDV